MNDIQQRVQEAIDRLVDSERGLQVAVYRHGQLVVDAVAGVADPATGRPVTIWGGYVGSPASFKGKFSDDRKTIAGRWEWPGGGYEATMTRAK